MYRQGKRHYSNLALRLPECFSFAKVNTTTNVASAYSKKADQSILKGLNDAFDGIGGVVGYNKSTGEFSYAKTVLVTKAQEQIDGWNKLIDVATQGIDLEDLAWSKLEVVKAEAEATKANETYDADYKAWEKARDKYIEVEAIDIDASKKAAEAAIAAYNKLGDAARTQDANISKLATALAEYYQDALSDQLGGFLQTYHTGKLQYTTIRVEFYLSI